MNSFAARVLFPPAPWRWLVWSAYAAAWTAALLVPVPVRAGESGLRSPEVLFYFAKTVHLSAYAVFAVLTGWLRVPARGAMLALLVGHAAGTEVLQYLLPTGRTGCVQDVLLDCGGIAAGVALSWKWWRPAGR